MIIKIFGDCLFRQRSEAAYGGKRRCKLEECGSKRRDL